jgi:transaldolase/glucose-6-phosphate isomerase
MIKVPATREGVQAIRALIGEGINVNVTLIFSLGRYEAVAKAYLAGLEDRQEQAEADLRVASVASFFVSRVDTAVDAALATIGAGAGAAGDLMGRIAIANARAAYARFLQIFSGERWERLATAGARVQRPLWASTSTKNPIYPDTLYVDQLIGAMTVNTIPPATLQAFIDHGTVARTIDLNVDQAEDDLNSLQGLGLDLETITQDLLEDGVRSFAKSFETLMDAISEKRERLLAGWEHLSGSLGEQSSAVEQAVVEMGEARVLPRIWEHDHTVWKPEPDEIANRLGWLISPEVMIDNVHRMQALVDGVRADGYTRVTLLGMGGSSLAPEVLQHTFGSSEGFLELTVLDSTDPLAVLEHEQSLDLARTLFIVATKSGGTVETLSLFKYFYNRVAELRGEDRVGPHFVAITDPGSAVFLNDPNIGGRYSALSFFGLVPAALMGIDVERLLGKALATACGTESCVTAEDNPGLWLGAVFGELAKAGRDKLTLISSNEVKAFGNWAEQLIAESTGKDGTGILPIVGEEPVRPEAYGDDRAFVYLRTDSDGGHDEAISRLEQAGQPVVRIRLHDRFDLGGQFFLWEMATAIAGHRMGIHPFDQPDVESAKVLARQMVAEFAQQGALPTEQPALRADGIAIYGSVVSESVEGTIEHFLAQAQSGAYVALQAYLKPSSETSLHLQALRHRLLETSGLPITVGYGPRYLHSTGQLHKGDRGNGLFLQFTTDDPHDLPIPQEAGSNESTLTFGALKGAQAMGDRRALEQAGRKVLRIHFHMDVSEGLERIRAALH